MNRLATRSKVNKIIILVELVEQYQTTLKELQ